MNLIRRRLKIAEEKQLSEQLIHFNELVENEKPTEKDLDRADGLKFLSNGRATFHGNGDPWASEASKMAKLIKDPAKLVRRAKAIIEVYPEWHYLVGDKECDIWTPFKEALLAMGFSYQNIADIENKKYA